MRSIYTDEKSRPKGNVYTEHPPARLSDWDKPQQGNTTPPLSPISRVLFPPTRRAHLSDVSIPHRGKTYNNATVCAPPTTSQQNLSGTSYPPVHYNSKHPPATGSMPTPYCYMQSDNITTHPTGVGPDYPQKKEYKRPTHTCVDEGPLAFKPAAASGEPPLENYPLNYEANHPFWYEAPPVAYGMPGLSMSLNAYGDAMDGSTHFIPGDVQPRPPQARLQSYNKTTVRELPYCPDPPTYEASHHSWYQQTPPVAYGMLGPSMSLNAYGDVMDGSTHCIPVDVQPRPPQARLQPYNNATMGGLPYYAVPPGSTNSYFEAGRRPGTMDNVKGK